MLKPLLLWRAGVIPHARQEVQDLTAYYEMCQSLADAIGFIKKQFLGFAEVQGMQRMGGRRGKLGVQWQVCFPSMCLPGILLSSPRVPQRLVAQLKQLCSSAKRCMSLVIAALLPFQLGFLIVKGRSHCRCAGTSGLEPQDFLPLKDALDLQKRFREGSVVGAARLK